MEPELSWQHLIWRHQVYTRVKKILWATCFSNRRELLLSLDERRWTLYQSLDGHQRQWLWEGSPKNLVQPMSTVHTPSVGMLLMVTSSGQGLCSTKLTPTAMSGDNLEECSFISCLRIEPKFTIEDQEPYGGGWCRWFWEHTQIFCLGWDGVEDRINLFPPNW